MRRCLIIGNQTLGGDALERVVRSRLDRGVQGFHVVAPMTRLEHEASEWSSGFRVGEDLPMPPGEFGAMLEQQQHVVDAARARARRRLELVLELIRSLGAEADGELGNPDPLTAARDALERDPGFEEIIISTLPISLSRWLEMELPARVARLTDTPVTTVTAPD
jgi:hypothetical protein